MEPSTSRETSFLGEPVLFHPFHGENIELLEHRRRALRRVSFEKGIVFSERALLEGECFFISIESVEGGWSGHLRIGLTSLDPETRPSIRNLDLNSWLFSVSPFIVPFQSPLTTRSLPTEKGSLIGVYYERINGAPR
ncbi:Neuralized [Oesophagostomum dentatum]|uniref:Neuralized n=1 Tax=Oesophagostomum dentatum TaxID=61180 RepID=A0A0B1T848_OESDE|nr:Neuralized [Oesophagostomum dentatum]